MFLRTRKTNALFEHLYSLKSFSIQTREYLRISPVKKNPRAPTKDVNEPIEKPKSNKSYERSRYSRDLFLGATSYQSNNLNPIKREPLRLSELNTRKILPATNQQPVSNQKFRDAYLLTEKIRRLLDKNTERSKEAWYIKTQKY